MSVASAWQVLSRWASLSVPAVALPTHTIARGKTGAGKSSKKRVRC
jgi:hypothetical protein